MKLEALKDNKFGGFKKGDVVECYDVKWMVDFDKRINDKGDFLDRLFFLVWNPDQGWVYIEKCFFKPVGAQLNKPGVCGEVE